MQWYGTVSPDQGEFELRLYPRSDTTDFELDQRVVRGTAHRSVSAIEELRAIAYLDPRVRYDGELVLVEEGKRADLHGLFFTSFIDHPERVESPWYRLHDQREGEWGNEPSPLWDMGRILVSINAIESVWFCSYNTSSLLSALSVSFPSACGTLPRVSRNERSRTRPV